MISDSIGKIGRHPARGRQERQLLGVIHLKDIIKAAFASASQNCAHGHPHRDDHGR